MKRVQYGCDDAMQKQYINYYTEQAGHGLPGFQGSRFQRGYGLGSLFKGLIRMASPLLKKGAIALGKTALKTGLSALEGDKRGPPPPKRSRTHFGVRGRRTSKRSRKDIF